MLAPGSVLGGGAGQRCAHSLQARLPAARVVSHSSGIPLTQSSALVPRIYPAPLDFRVWKRLAQGELQDLP